MKKLIAVFMIITMLLAGCAMFQDRPALTELAVKAATVRVFIEKPDWKDEAVRVLSVALIFVDESTEVDLQVLETLVLSEIDFGRLTPEETELLTLLIIAVREEIEFAIEKQQINIDNRVVVAEVLRWILEVAKR